MTGTYLRTGLRNRRVIEKRIYPNGGSGATWATRTTFLPFYLAQGEPPGTVSVTNWSSATTIMSKTRHYFYSYSLPYGNADDIAPSNITYTDPLEGREYKTEEFGADASTVLRSVDNTWSSRLASSWSTYYPICSNCTLFYGPPVDPRVTETLSKLSDTNQISKRTIIYDQYNNQTDTYEFDFGAPGSGQPGSLIRRSHTNYVTSSDYVSIAGGTNADATATIYLLNLPLTEQVYDGNGVLRSHTIFDKADLT